MASLLLCPPRNKASLEHTMDIIESVMVCMLVALVLATITARWAGNEPRDVGLLAALTALWGAGTAAAVLAS